jgi:predicted PurR-regulated permease PerM
MSDTLPPSTPSRAQVQVAETSGLRGLLTLAVVVVVVAVLYLAREVMIPITFAVLLSFALAPLVDLLRRLRIGRIPSVILAVIMALSLVLALASLIGTQFAQLAANLPLYEITMIDKVQAVRGFITSKSSNLISDLDKRLQETAPSPAPSVTGPSPGGSAVVAPKPTQVEVVEPPATPLQLAERILAPLAGPLGTAFIVFVVTVFVLLQREDLRDRMIRLVGSRDLHRTTAALDDAAWRLSRYLLTQLGVNAGFGLVIGMGLTVIGVPSPLLWGVLSALLRFVPYIGSLLSGALPVAIAAAVEPGWSMTLWTLALYIVIEPIVGQVIEPLLYGHSTGMSPFSVVIAAIFWTWLWGPIGLILSTPLTLCLVVLGRHMERLEFLDVLLGDQPALTPAENLYQRLLAGDTDEAAANAELLLKERPLSSYYDEIALKGLQLAAHDVRRGALSSEQVACIKAATDELIEALSDHEDIDPPPTESADTVAALPIVARSLPSAPAPDGSARDLENRGPTWRTQTPVLCVAGRGPLDEPAAAMLVQLLAKHGIGARLLPYEAVSRSAIATLDPIGVALICIACLEISGSPAHLRYLLRRLRQRLAGVPVLVGLWQTDEAVQGEPGLRALISADFTASTLREAVNVCLEQACSPPEDDRRR